MNKIVKNTLILTVITVVAGLLLGVVYGVTKDPIAKAQENAKQEAFRSVLTRKSAHCLLLDGQLPWGVQTWQRHGT